MTLAVSLLLLVLFSDGLLAQSKATEKPTIHVLARRTKEMVILRWAPSTIGLWKVAQRNGYLIERAPMRSNGSAGTFTIINDSNLVTPWLPDQWIKASYDTVRNAPKLDSMQMAYTQFGSLLYEYPSDRTDIVPYPPSAITSFKETEELVQQYSFGMMSADRSAISAEGMGLRFHDKTAQPNEAYVYRISVWFDKEDVASIVFGTVNVSTDVYSPKITPNAIRAEELEQAITLRWNGRTEHTAHRVERSDDGGRAYRALTTSPMITLITGDTLPSSVEFYADTALVNYKVYYYRVYGYDSFGDMELLGEVKATPRDKTPPTMPTEVHADNISPTKVKISWSMHTPIEKDLAGFHIGKDTVDEGDDIKFPRITTTMLPATAREYVDQSGVFATKNYYVVEAIDTAGNKIRSFSAYCVMVDSTPTSPPVIRSAIMDSSGIVSINITAPKERDLMGYRLLFANDTTHEFSVIREYLNSDSYSATRDTVLFDTVTVNSLTSNVYYRIYALDYHYNQSNVSNTIRARRPDVIPPVSPVITGYTVTDSSVVITFAPSTSSDVAGHVVRRRRDDGKDITSVSWDSIAAVTGSIFIDRSSVVNALYDYVIVARDSSGLYSDPSSIVTAKRYDNGLRPSVRNLRAVYDSVNKKVNLSWQYDKLDEQCSFIIYRGTGTRVSSYSVVKNSEARTFTDEKIPSSGVTIEYAVKVVTESGAESTLSSPITIRK